MAKKSKSKNKSNLNMILSCIVLLLALATIGMAFLTAVKYTGRLTGNDYTFSGFQTMFGYSQEATTLGVTVKSEYLGFSILSVLAYILPLIGACLLFVKNKLVKCLGAVLMLAGTVLLFLVPNFVVLAKANGNLTAAALILDSCTKAIGIGAILAGVMASIATLLSAYVIVKSK